MTSNDKIFVPDLLPPDVGVYESREASLTAIKEHAKWHGYAVSIKRTYGRGNHCKVQCTRGQVRKCTVPDDRRIRKRMAATVDCPFDMRIHRAPSGMMFWTEIKNPSHNHHSFPSIEAHPYGRKFSKEQIDIIERQASCSAATDLILSQLRGVDPQIPDSHIRRKDVQNARRRFLEVRNADKTALLRRPNREPSPLDHVEAQSAQDQDHSRESSQPSLRSPGQRTQAQTDASAPLTPSISVLSIESRLDLDGFTQNALEMARRAAYAAAALPNATNESVTYAFTSTAAITMRAEIGL